MVHAQTYWRIKTASVFFFLLVATVLPIPYVDSPVETNGNITFQPNSIPSVNVYYSDYSFVFECKSHFIRLRPFVIYNGSHYGMKQIVTWLKNEYPNINYAWLVEKSTKIIHYGFNLTKLPQNIADKIDYLGFKLVDMNFPTSWLTLEQVPKNGINVTKIYIKKTNMYFSFEDLYPLGYSIEHLNSTHVLIGNVKGKTDLIIDPISYGDPTLTVIGYSEGSDCAYWDLWNASYVNGWNISDQLSENATYGIGFKNFSYIFDCKLVVGDGSTLTWFADEGVSVTFLDQVGSDTILVKNNATFRYGRLLNASGHATCDGVKNNFHKNSYYGIRGEAGSTINIYSSLLTSWGYVSPSLVGSVRITLPSNARLWETELNKVSLTAPSAEIDVYRATITMANYGIQKIEGTNLEDIRIHSSTTALFYEAGDQDATISGLNVANIDSYLASVDGAWSNDLFLVNTISDNWQFFFWATSSGEIYRQYSFVANITDGNAPLQNANVTIYDNRFNNGTWYQIGSWLTWANGTFPLQTLTKEFYNQTGGNSPYSYEPINITVSLSGYQTYSQNLTLDEPLNFPIALTASVPSENLEMYFLLGAVLTVCVGGVLVFIKKGKGREETILG